MDANEIHEKQSEETLSDIKAKKMEKFSLLPIHPSSSFFNLVCRVLLLAYLIEWHGSKGRKSCNGGQTLFNLIALSSYIIISV